MTDLEQYSTLILIETKNDGIISSYVKYNGDQLAASSEYRLATKFGVSKSQIIWHHDCGTQTEAVKLQRRYHLATKLFYNAGTGNVKINADLAINTMNYLLRFDSRDDMIELYNHIYTYVNKDNDEERGILYIMKDFTEDKVFYKIGTTCESKGAEGRLAELKRSHYLSECAFVVDQIMTDSRYIADYFEGLFHIIFADKKISCPNRKQNVNGNKFDNFDETFEIDNADVINIMSVMMKHRTPEEFIEQFNKIKGN